MYNNTIIGLQLLLFPQDKSYTIESVNQKLRPTRI